MADLTIIVTGSRHATFEQHAPMVLRGLYWALATKGVWRARFLAKLPRLRAVLRHGACPYGGIDEIAERLATGPMIPAGRQWYGVVAPLSEYVDWEIQRRPAKVINGRILGPERNRRMCREGGDIILAFPDQHSRGTWNCLKEGALMGIPGRVYPIAT